MGSDSSWEASFLNGSCIAIRHRNKVMSLRMADESQKLKELTEGSRRVIKESLKIVAQTKRLVDEMRQLKAEIESWKSK